MRTATELRPRIKTRGELFSARGCSGGCTCDPCECDPCTCGSDELHPNPPRWRVSGCQMYKSKLRGTDVSGLVIFSLALPLSEEPGAAWHEVLLVDSRASDEQLARLLAKFEPELISMPVAYRTSYRPLPAVFRVPMSYTSAHDGRSRLSVDCSPNTLELVRVGAGINEPFTWRYDGAMAVQEYI